MHWAGWTIHRVLVLFTGVAFLLVFIQVTLFHYRQNFRHWSMWIPVLGTPLFGLVAVILTFYNAPWLRGVFGILMGIGVLAGIFGTVMHVRGVGQRVDGYKLRNFLVGPPLALPAVVSAMSILGLIALYWR